MGAMQAALLVDMAPLADTDFPEVLMDPADIDAQVEAIRPAFIGDAVADPKTEIVMRKLSNGMGLSYKLTKFEKGQGIIRVLFRGGRSVSSATVRAGSAIHTFASSGVSRYRAAAVDKFMSMHGMEGSAVATAEYFVMQVCFSLSDDGMQRACELINLYLTQPMWEDCAFDRTKSELLLELEALERDSELRSNDELLHLLTGGDVRFTSPTAKEIRSMRKEDCRQLVEEHLHPKNCEVICLGDFPSGEFVESHVLRYLGTFVGWPANPSRLPPALPQFSNLPRSPGVRQDGIGPGAEADRPWRISSRVEVRKDQPRAEIMVGTTWCNRWGMMADGRSVAQEIGKPFGTYHVWRCLIIFTELVNERLFKTVREKHGLCYRISFSTNTYEFFNGGWAYVSCNASPEEDRLMKTVGAVVEVLQSMLDSVTQEDYDMTVKPLLAGLEQSLGSSNDHWLELMQGLHLTGGRKRVEHLQDIIQYYRSLTREDVLEVARLVFRPTADNLYIVLGISGGDPDGDPPVPDGG
eukprot:NODE_336_length_1612_cov_75.086372_g252_i0.p1 GENE.NODE_336_length_1612_cov_75.086372_g252_i0~~NODE_336_length_1612_cov_75.086372_g252_i0.p1  ORF type:complete len:530 (-),score=202.07 NODE_336_length_1612_cov_75.086372_g252_i0:22-1590(-)